MIITHIRFNSLILLMFSCVPHPIFWETCKFVYIQQEVPFCRRIASIRIMENSFACALESLEDVETIIPIGEEKMFLGRSLVTKIIHPNCSKKQSKL